MKKGGQIKESVKEYGDEIKEDARDLEELVKYNLTKNYYEGKEKLKEKGGEAKKTAKEYADEVKEEARHLEELVK